MPKRYIVKLIDRKYPSNVQFFHRWLNLGGNNTPIFDISAYDAAQFSKKEANQLAKVLGETCQFNVTSFLLSELV